MAKAKSASTAVKTRIDISADNRKKVGALLNQLLADASDLSMQCKHAHWNVAGPHFIGLHKLFDELYEAAGEHIDLLAERIAALGVKVHGRLQDAEKNTQLTPFPDKLPDDLAFVSALANVFGDFSNSVRDAIDKTEDLEDMVTSDLLNGIDQKTDQHLWFLEAHLRKPL